MDERLQVNEIFGSINGEVNWFGQGALTTFIRLQGCNLRCSWCDTKYAWEKDKGKLLSIDEIMEEVKRLNNPTVVVTGGEPLLQSSTPALLVELDDKGFSTVLETNGSIDFTRSWVKADSIMADYKLPGSDMGNKMLPLRKFSELNHRSGIKFVVSNREDFDHAKKIIHKLAYMEHQSYCIAFSCAEGLKPNILYEWLDNEIKEEAEGDDIRDRVRLNVQLHKIIGVR